MEENSSKPLQEHVTQVGLRSVSRKRLVLDGKQHAAIPAECWATEVITLFPKIMCLGEWREAAFLSGNGGIRIEVKAWASTSDLMWPYH